MNPHLRNELIWLLSIIVATTAIIVTVFGKEDLFSNTLDINIHDTYYVIESLNTFLGIGALLVFVVYPLRLFLANFRNRFANFVFLLSNGYLIFLLPFIITIATEFNTTFYPDEGHTLYPPVDTLSGDSAGQGIEIRSALIILQLLLIITFGYYRI